MTADGTSGSSADDESGARPVRIPTRTKRGRRRWVWCAVASFAVLVVAVLAWLLVTGLKARTQLEAVRSEVRQLRAQISAGDLSGARTTVRELRAHADDAHDLTTGPVWAMAATVPYLGNPADTVRTLTTSVDQVAGGALPALVEASKKLDPSTLRAPDGTIDLAPIRAVAPTLDAAVATLAGASRRIDQSPASSWLSSVNAARDDLANQLQKLTPTVVAADVAARTVPALLGADGPKSYFVSFQNEAELRGLGGLPGAFAIVRADHGKITFTRFENDNALSSQSSGLRFDGDYRHLYARTGASAPFDPTRLYVNSDVSPHFPYAARIWLAMWQRKTGQRLDGALTLDPTAVGRLLAVTGPAHLRDGTVVSAANVVPLTQQTAYDRFAANNTRRKQFLLDIARAVSRRLIDTKADTTALVRAAAKSVGEHRMLVFSTDAALEAQLQRTTISGIVPATKATYAGLSLINDMTGKLDFYLSASLRWRSSGCGATRNVVVTISMRNDAPANLPDYVLGLYGRPGHPKHKGDNQQVVDYFATVGAEMTSVEINGKRAGAAIGRSQGHPVYRVELPLPRGTVQTIVLRLREPAGGAPAVRAQPMIRPVHVEVQAAACS